ncbi:MAG: Thiamine biosynthesis lipoprotein ApbE precursor [Smithella sp. PtaU1.Bin162]|nr:MAG: Thiamine biosynthesis lipoprotein ApbE precursor [Smithella sp. PtaU1.Bin162]
MACFAKIHGDVCTKHNFIRVVPMKAALLSILLAGLVVLSCNKPEPVVEAKDFAMGTVITQKIYGANSKAAAAEAISKIRELEKILSFYLADSDISLLNNSAGRGKVRLHPETFFLLTKSSEYAHLSGGEFNIMVGPLVKRWKVTAESPDVPSPAEIKSLLTLIDYRDLHLYKDDCSARLARKGQMVDLGGIAKGYAGDEVIKIYGKHGIKSAIVDIGGNICVLGLNTDGTPWNVGIQDPRRKRGIYIGSVSLSDKAVSTSGAYERFFPAGGKKYHHIIDPRTGYPSESDLLSVTIIADSSLDTDALSTTIFILGLDKGIKLIKKIKGTEAVLIKNDGAIYATEGLQKNFNCSAEVIYR